MVQRLGTKPGEYGKKSPRDCSDGPRWRMIRSPTNNKYQSYAVKKINHWHVGHLNFLERRKNGRVVKDNTMTWVVWGIHVTPAFWIHQIIRNAITELCLGSCPSCPHRGALMGEITMSSVCWARLPDTSDLRHFGHRSVVSNGQTTLYLLGA